MSKRAPVKVLVVSNPDEDFIKLARDRYKDAVNAESTDVAEAKVDVDFVAGDQWDERSKKIRSMLFRPMLVWNRLHTFVQQVCNDGRQNKPSIHVTAADGGNAATAEILKNRIRQIEYESDADTAYDAAREQQVICGRGFYRITTAWAKPPKWKQEIRIEHIPNQFSVVFDPGAKKYDRSDAEYCFVDTLMNKDAYRREFGSDTPLAVSDFFANTENVSPDWVNVGEKGEFIRIAEYWLKEYKQRTLCQLHNGDSAWKDELPEGTPVKNEREENDCTVTQYIIDGCSILKKRKFVIPFIPIIPQWGRIEIVKGKKRHISLTRYAHDAQRLVNLYVSNIAEQVAMTPKTPYIGYEGVFDDHEEDWSEVNNIPKAYLQIKPTFAQGQLLPPPERAGYEPPIQALSLGLGQAVDALKAACNIYDASLGNAPPDASGLAIQRRNTESDTGNYHFIDNESMSRKYAGRIILKLIAALESNETTVPTRTEDGKIEHVKLNTPVKHRDGSTVIHKLDEGDYEPHISTGPSYTSQRQEAYSIYSQIAQSDKNFMQIAGDKLFRNMDAPGADEIADRYAKMLPAALQPAGDPAQLTAKLQHGMQMVHDLSAKVHELQDIIDSKKPELAARVQIAQMQEETKRQNITVQATIAEANLGMKSAMFQLQQQVGAIQHSLDHSQTQEQMTMDQHSKDFDALMDHYSSMGAGAPDGSDQPPTDDSGDSGSAE